MKTLHSKSPTAGPSVPPRTTTGLTWWPFALAGIVAVAGVTWATRAPAAADQSKRRAGLGELVVPQDVRSAVLMTRSDRRAAIAHAVVRGEISLLSAAAAYRELGAGDPEAVASLRRVFLGESDDERYVRSVIQRVRIEQQLSKGDPAVADRLEAELKRHLAAGPLRLPAQTDAQAGADAGVVKPV